MESSISSLDPTAFGRKGSLISSGVVKFVCGLLLTTVSIGLYYCRTNRSTHGEYFRAKMLGEFAFHLTAIRHFFMLIANFYGEEPPGIENYTYVSFMLFFRVLGLCDLPKQPRNVCNSGKITTCTPDHC